MNSMDSNYEENWEFIMNEVLVNLQEKVDGK